MHRFKREKIKGYSTSNYEGLHLSYLAMLSLGAVVFVFSLFILLNILIRTSLTNNSSEILDLLNTKYSQEKMISSQETKIEKLTSKLSSKISENKKLDFNLKKETKEKNNKIKMLKEANSKNTNLTYKVNNLSSNNNDLLRSFEMEQEEHISLKSAHDNLKYKHDTLKYNFENLEKNLKEEKDKVKTLQDKLFNNVAELEETEKELDSLEDKNSRLERIIRNLKNDLEKSKSSKF